ncbi:MAG TPA: putative lipid II flippase FtsW [bacterium]|nr:putative lipid II flippase FtsW [bacterium]
MANPFRYLYRKLVQQQMQGYDLLLLLTTVLLLLVGTMIIFSASSSLSDREFGGSLYFLRHHLLHVASGLAAMVLGMRVPLAWWRRSIPAALLLCFLLLVAVLVPGIGHAVGGARRWFRLGGVSIQPTELLKPALIAFLAGYLDRKQEQVRDFLRGMVPGLIVMGAFLLLVLLQPDFGSVVLITVTLLLMIFVGGAKPQHILASVAGLGLVGVYLMVSRAYRMKRLLAFLNPWDDRLNTGFQIVQSYLAFGNGGVLGVGLGDSRQKMFFLPDAHTDFIFSILGEELGLIGVVCVVLLFACFLWRGYRASLAARDDFARYLAYGITTLLALQVVLNLAVVMGLLPTKGLPLPLISYGGSSLVLTLFMTGLLLNIGRKPTPWSADVGSRLRA